MDSVALSPGLAKSSLEEQRKPIPDAKLAMSRPCIPVGRQAVTNGSLGTIFIGGEAVLARDCIGIFGGFANVIMDGPKAGEIPATRVTKTGLCPKAEFPPDDPVQFGESFIALAEIPAQAFRALSEGEARSVEKRMFEAVEALAAAEDAGAGKPQKPVFPVAPARDGDAATTASRTRSEIHDMQEAPRGEAGRPFPSPLSLPQFLGDRCVELARVLRRITPPVFS